MVTKRTDIIAKVILLAFITFSDCRYLRLRLPFARDHSTDTRSSVEGPGKAFEGIWD